MKLIKIFFQTLYTIYVYLIFIITFFIQLPFFLILFFFFPKVKGTHLIYQLLRIWTIVFYFIIGQRVVIYGKENIVRHKPLVVVANHIAYIDTVNIFTTLPFTVMPIGRSDMANIPLFGTLYKRMCVLVDRSSSVSRRKSFLRLKKHLEEDDLSIFVFPEGQFNKTDDYLKSFFDGAFKIALETETDILPIIFPDTYDRWNPNKWNGWTPGINRSYILPIIPYETFRDLHYKELKDKVWHIMYEAYRKIDEHNYQEK